MFIIMMTTLTSCYHAKNTHAYKASNDTTSFYNTHHYAQNYNFIVKKDSLVLLKQQPEELLSNMPTDSLTIKSGDNIVVVDIRILKNDKQDSIWVQVARDQYTFGWIHESSLLPNVVPDDPISQFISTFSDIHLIVFLVIISIIAACYIVHLVKQKNTKVVHFNDIDSFYPTLLSLNVASSATFYSSIQMFTPDVWRNFYFHPSLNPFAEPTTLAIFLASVWAMIVIAIATVDDVYHKLPVPHATLYLCGLGAVCAANYIIFSLTTLYYIGYVLLFGYYILAIRLYVSHNYHKYICGNCGAKLSGKGICPKCGAINT